MGGGTKSVDSAGAAQAKKTEQAVTQQQMSIAADQNNKQNALYKTLFGDGTTGGGGSLSSFLDPNSLNVTKPTGVYDRQYQGAVQQGENEATNQRASQARSMASRGFGAAPAGFAADQDRQSRLATADAKGAAYTDAVGSQYKDALSNFWNATGTASDTMRGATGAASQNLGAAGGQSVGMYNGGNQQQQKSNLLGNVISGGAQVGAAALCPARGSLILMADGTKKPVEELKQGDAVAQLGGGGGWLLNTPDPVITLCVLVTCTDGKQRKVSESHTFAVPHGGYVAAKNARGWVIVAETHKARTVESVEAAGEDIVYPLNVSQNNSYCADDLWALA